MKQVGNLVIFQEKLHSNQDVPMACLNLDESASSGWFFFFFKKKNLEKKSNQLYPLLWPRAQTSLASQASLFASASSQLTSLCISTLIQNLNISGIVSRTARLHMELTRCSEKVTVLQMGRNTTELNARRNFTCPTSPLLFRDTQAEIWPTASTWRYVLQLYRSQGQWYPDNAMHFWNQNWCWTYTFSH